VSGIYKGLSLNELGNVLPSDAERPDSIVSFSAAGRNSALSPMMKQLGKFKQISELENLTLAKKNHLRDNVEDVAPEAQESDESDSS